MSVRDEIRAVPPADRAEWKAARIAESGSLLPRTNLTPRLEVEILRARRTRNGVVLGARAWFNGQQIGFGADGTVDIEIFRFLNPPLLDDDPAGEIEIDNGDGSTRRLTYAPRRAILKALRDTIAIVGKPGGNIVPGKIGTTTSTIYSATADGSVQRTGVNQTWADIRSGAGTGTATGVTNSAACKLLTSATTNQYEEIYRAIYKFDTSAIGDDEVSSATFSVDIRAAGDQISGGAANGSKCVLSGASPAGSTLVNADYGSGEATELGDRSVVYNSLPGTSQTSMQSLSLNSSGLAYINGAGTTWLMLRLAWDFDNLAPHSNGATWGSGDRLEIRGTWADETGTTWDPKLVVEHAPAGSGAGWITFI